MLTAVLLGTVVVLSASTPSAVAAQAASPVGGPDKVRWQPIFAEDFSDPRASALLSNGRWHSGWWGDGIVTWPVNSAETALYDRRLISSNGGVATFAAGGVAAGITSGGVTKRNAGSIITTDPAQGAEPGFTMGYGYVEARLQQPAGTASQALWPAFWLNAPEWPQGMEIDVLEGDGTDTGNSFNVHVGPAGTDVTNLNAIERSVTVHGATTGMHTYAADIRTDGVTFYYDGEPVYAYAGPVPDAQRYLVIGLSTSGTLTTTEQLRVDYVRAWRRA